MPFRILGLGILVVAVLATSGCLWCRPCGYHHHRCCYAPPAASAEAVIHDAIR
jgi:hypothetical protein